MPSRRFTTAAIVVAALSICLVPVAAQEAAQEPDAAARASVEIPDDLSPKGENTPLLHQDPLESIRYDDNGFPEDALGTLVVAEGTGGWFVSMYGVADPFLLYAQFTNSQRDAVLLARDGTIRDTRPDGTVMEIPYGFGALRTSTIAISLVEALVLPHVSDARKDYQLFPLQDLYLGASLGVTGLLAELRFVHQERFTLHAQAGLNFLGGTSLAPLGYWAATVHLGAGAQFPGFLENLLGRNHWTVGGDLLLGLGDADRNAGTPTVVWMPGAFFELEKRDLFGWGDRWAGFGAQGDYHDDPRPLNYHARALYARVGVYLDLQNWVQAGPVLVDVSVGFRYNLVGPRIPPHRFKQTSLQYISEEYREQVLLQREQRQKRIEQAVTSP